MVNTKELLEKLESDIAQRNHQPVLDAIDNAVHNGLNQNNIGLLVQNACQHFDGPFLRQFLSRQPDLLVQNKYGWTAAHVLAYLGKTEGIDILGQYSLNTGNNVGFDSATGTAMVGLLPHITKHEEEYHLLTPLQFARMMGKDDCAKKIEEYLTIFRQRAQVQQNIVQQPVVAPIIANPQAQQPVVPMPAQPNVIPNVANAPVAQNVVQQPVVAPIIANPPVQQPIVPNVGNAPVAQNVVQPPVVAPIIANPPVQQPIVPNVGNAPVAQNVQPVNTAAALVHPQRTVAEDIKRLKERFQLASIDAYHAHKSYVQLKTDNASLAEIETANRAMDAAFKIKDQIINELTVAEDIEIKAQQEDFEKKKKDAAAQNKVAVRQVPVATNNAVLLPVQQQPIAVNVNNPTVISTNDSILNIEELNEKIKALAEHYRIATLNSASSYGKYMRMVKDKASAEEIEAAKIAKDADFSIQMNIDKELSSLEEKLNKAKQEAFEKKKNAAANPKNAVGGQIPASTLVINKGSTTPALVLHQQKQKATNNNNVNANVNLAAEQNDQEAFNKIFREVNQAYDALKATKDGQVAVQKTKKHAAELNIILEGLSREQISVNIVEKDSFPTLEITTSNTQLNKMFVNVGFELLGNDGKFTIFPSFKGDNYPGKMADEHPGYSLLMQLGTLPALNKFINPQSITDYYAIKDNNNRSKFDKFSRYYLSDFIQSCTPKDSVDYAHVKKIEHDLLINYFDLKLKKLNHKNSSGPKNS